MDLISCLNIFFLLFTSGYVLLLLTQLIYWTKIPVFYKEPINGVTKITVLIAMRNEENNIVSCLHCLTSQNYPAHLFEVIVLDDHSTDSSVMQVNNFIRANPLIKNIKLIEIKDGQLQSSYKKFAITEGIKQASGELIITTDADCVAGKQWLSVIASYYEKFHPVMMMCPVQFANEKTFFSKMQALEFAGLIGMSAATNNAGIPLMCNGANLAYSKKAFTEINGYGNTPELASGDDTFLLFKLKEKFKNDIHFVKSLDASVITKSQPTLTSFFQQRKRWASKTTKYKKPYITRIGLLIYFFNLSLLLSGIFSCFATDFFSVFLLMFSLKLVFEFTFMFMVCRFFKQLELLLVFLPTALLFTPYILLVGIVAPFGTYEWKGRRVR